MNVNGVEQFITPADPCSQDFLAKKAALDDRPGRLPYHGCDDSVQHKSEIVQGSINMNKTHQ